MPEPTLSELGWTVRDHERRIAHVEEELDEMQPDVIVKELERLSRALERWQWLLIGGVLSIIGALIGAQFI